jgi:hypothetical protein
MCRFPQYFEYVKNLLLSAVKCYIAIDIMRTEVHANEPFAPEHSSLWTETAVEKLKGYESQGIQIPAELIQAGGKRLHSGIHKLLSSIWNK